jgi:hypothetical protein
MLKSVRQFKFLSEKWEPSRYLAAYLLWHYFLNPLILYSPLFKQ